MRCRHASMVAWPVGLCCGLAVGCVPAAPEHRLHLVVRAALDPDALRQGSPVASFAARLSPADSIEGTDLVFDYTPAGELILLDAVEAPAFAGPARVRLWGLDPTGTGAVSAGRSAPFFLDESAAGAPTEVFVYLAVPSVWSRVPAEGIEVGAYARATALEDGRVLLAGGETSTGPAAPLRYDHATGALRPLEGGPASSWPAVVALSGGRALIAGGIGSDGESAGTFLFADEAWQEIEGVHPQSGGMALFFAAEDLAVVAGGFDANGAALDTVSVIDVGTVPAAARTLEGRLLEPRALASATAIVGTVPASWLLAGGQSARVGGSVLATAEVLSIENGEVAGAAPVAHPSHRGVATMGWARVHHVAVALGRGQVLIYGGSDGSDPLLEPEPVVFSAELPAPGAFLPLQAPVDGWPMPSAALAAGFGPLADGSAVLAGGLFVQAGEPAVSSAVARFIPVADQDLYSSSEFLGRWEPLPALRDPRAAGALVALPAGELMLAGGGSGAGWFDQGRPDLLHPPEVLLACDALGSECVPP